jgi:UDP-galactopyranose mutase
VSFDCIVVALHLRYDGVRQRPHHIIERLAARVPVLVVEEPFAAGGDYDDLATFGNVTRLRPKRRAPLAQHVDDVTLRSVRAWLGARAPLLWFYQPMMHALAEAFPDAPLVYDCMDELAAFDFASPELPAREAALQARARVVFAGGRTLFESRRAIGPKLRLFPSGVDADHFAQAIGRERPQLLASLARPVCTYVGAIDERVDFAVTDALAARAASVVLVGPVVKIDAARLPRHPSVHFAGAVPYADVPALLAGTDVAIMPFAINAATRAISPTKTPEYLAAGRPVVSTPIADVIADYGTVVRVAHTPGAFADACFAAFEHPDADAVARGKALARNYGWDAIVTRMWQDIQPEPARA